MTVLHETRLVFSRAVRLSLRSPIWLILGIVQPIMYLVLFGPLLERVTRAPGFPPGDAWQVFVPGLLVLLGLFGAAFVGFGLIAETQAGVIERLRVTPVSRTALLLGRVGRDVLVVLVQGAILVAVAYPFGLRAPLEGIVLGLLVVAGLGAAFASLSYAAALVLRTNDAMASTVNGLTLPLLLLSGILLPMSLAPAWLELLSQLNPLTYVVDGVRALFVGDVTSAAAGWGLLAVAGLAAAGVLVGTRTFRRDTA